MGSYRSRGEVRAGRKRAASSGWQSSQVIRVSANGEQRNVAIKDTPITIACAVCALYCATTARSGPQRSINLNKSRLCCVHCNLVLGTRQTREVVQPRAA
jgi:hypothetical protein